MKKFGLIILAITFPIIASSKEQRKPSAISRSSGVVCAQDTTLQGAAAAFNYSTGNLDGNTIIVLPNSQSATVNGSRISNLTVHTTENKQNGSGYDYIICGVVSR